MSQFLYLQITLQDVVCVSLALSCLVVSFHLNAFCRLLFSCRFIVQCCFVFKSSLVSFARHFVVTFFCLVVVTLCCLVILLSSRLVVLSSRRHFVSSRAIPYCRRWLVACRRLFVVYSSSRRCLVVVSLHNESVKAVLYFSQE